MTMPGDDPVMADMPDSEAGVPLYVVQLRQHLRNLLKTTCADSDGSVKLSEHDFRDLFLLAGIVEEHDADYDPDPDETYRRMMES